MQGAVVVQNDTVRADKGQKLPRVAGELLHLVLWQICSTGSVGTAVSTLWGTSVATVLIAVKWTMASLL